MLMIKEGQQLSAIIMNKRFYRMASMIIACILLSTSFTACGNKKTQDGQQGQAQQMSTGDKSDKLPEQLTSMEDNIETIIQELKGPAVLEKKKTEQQGKEQEGKKQEKQGDEESKSKSEDGTSEGSGKEKDSSGDSSGKKEETGSKSEKTSTSQDTSKQQDQGQTPKDPWQEIDKAMTQLHYEFNSYLPSAVKMGASRKLVDEYSTALNNLTNTILTKHRMNTILTASKAYSFIPEFYALYRTPMSPDIKRIRYYIRNAMVNAMVESWPQAASDIKNAKDTWSFYKNALGKEQQETASKLDYSISELEKVVKEKNKNLCDIKGRVSLSNVQALEKTMKKGQGQQGEQKGGQGEGDGSAGDSGS